MKPPPPPPRLAPDEELFTRGPAKRPAAPGQLPATVEEAERRYFARYGWPLVAAVFGPIPQPETISEWVGLAEETRDYLAQSEAERLARRLEDLAAAIRRKAEQ